MSYYAMVIVVEAVGPHSALEVLGLDDPQLVTGLSENVEFVGKPVLVETDENGSFEHLDQWEEYEA